MARIHNHSNNKPQAKEIFRLKTDTRQHLKQYYFVRLAPPTDIHSKPQGKRKLRLPWFASSSVASSTSNPSLPRCGPRLAPRACTCSRSTPRTGLPALYQRGLWGREIVDAQGRRGEWWMLRPADVVSGPRADRPGTWQKARPPPM